MTLTRRLCLMLALGIALVPFVPPPVAAEISGPYLAARQAARAGDYRAATAYFARAIVEDPANTSLMEGLISAYIGTGEIDKAVPVARRYLTSGGRAQEAMIVLLADQLRRRGYDQVLTDLETGRLVGPLVDGLIGAWAELGVGRMAQALDGFDKLAQTPGLAGVAGYHKALALASVGDFESADEIFADEATGIRRTRRGAFAHAQILSQLERNADALAALDSLFGPASTDPELDALRGALRAGEPIPFTIAGDAAEGMAEAFHTLASALEGEAPDAQALIYARVAEFLRPELPDAILMSAALLESMAQYELAIAAYSRIPATSAVHLAAETGRAQALHRLGSKDEALAALTALAQTHGQYLSVHVALGDMLRQEERFAEAAEAYGRAIDLVPGPETRHWALFYSRAIAWERAKEWDRAEPDFRRALALNPEQPQVLNYLGYSMLDMNRNIPEAMDMIERAVAQRPDDGYIIDSLAWGYFKLGRYEEALAPMERASLLMPVDPIVTDHLGDVYWAVGRKLEAQFQWRRALSFSPDESDAVRIRRKLEIGLDAVLAEEGAEPLDARGHGGN